MSSPAVSNGSAGSTSAAPTLPPELVERLSDPKVVASLTQLLDRVDVVLMLVESLDGLLRHSETILESAVDSATDLRTTVDATPGATSVDIAKTIGAASALAAVLPDATPAIVRGVESGALDELTSPELVSVLGLLSDPQVSASLATLVERLDLLVLLVQSLDGFLRHSETVMESVVDSAADFRATVDALPGTSDLAPGLDGVDVRASAAAAVTLLAALPDMAPALVRGAESGAIEALTSPGLVEVLKLAAAGVQDGLADPAPVHVRGALSAARILRDPDVGRALGFFATIARSIGRNLPNTPNVHNPQ